MKRRTIVFCYFLLIILSILVVPTVGLSAEQDLSLDQQEWLKKKKVLIVAGDREHPPFEYRNQAGNYVGFNVDMIRALSKELGIPVQFKSLPWAMAIEQLDQGKVDLIQGMRYSQDRFLLYNFTKPYLMMSSQLFVLKDRLDIINLNDLTNRKVAVQRGDFAHDYLNKIPGINLVLFDDQQQALQALLNYQVDAYAGSEISTLYCLQRLGKVSQLKRVGDPIETTNYGIALNKDNIVLLHILNHGLTNLEKKGISEEIHDKWFGHLISSLDESFLGKILVIALSLIGAILLVLGIIFSWNLTLKKQISLKTAELVKMNNQLYILNQVACSTSQSLDLQVVLESSLKMILQSLDLNRGMISIFNETKQQLEIAFQCGYTEELLAALGVFIPGEGFVGKVFMTGKPLLIENMAAHPNRTNKLSPDLVNNYQLNSYLGIPLIVRGKVLGVLSVVANRGYYFGEHDFELLTTIGTQIGIALDNARMYESVRKRMLELDVIRQISNKITSISDLNELLQKTVEVVKGSFGYEIFIINLIDKKTGEIVNKAVAGTSPYIVTDNEFRMDKGVTGWVARQGEAVMIGDVSKDSRYFTGFIFPDGRKIQSLLSVPIKFKEEIIGLLHIESTELNAFDQDDLFILTTLAQSLAIAIKNAEAREEIEEDFLATLSTLAALIELKDPYTGGHSQKVKEYSLAIADKLGLNSELKEDLEIAASLHDIGKIGVENNILNKPGKLTEAEYEVIKTHPLLGENCIKYIKKLEGASHLVRYHHEHYNGAGYPEGLAGEHIPLGARIIAVADAFDAMTSDRVYRKAMSLEKAISILKAEKGKQFCPHCVDKFLEYLKEKQ